MKTPEYFKEIGYEDHGYVSPELSSSDTYPDYIKQEVAESVKEIQKHQNADTVTFAFMTDIHYANFYNHEIRMKRTLNAYKEIAKRVQIDKLVLGGDYTNEGCKEYKSDCYRELRALFDGIEFFPVHGNHDDGTIWDIQYIKSDKSTNHITHDELYTLFYNHVPQLGAKLDKSNPSLYYLIDDEVTKTRYICLDSVDIPYVYDENEKLLYNGQWRFALSQKQIDWLLNEALRFDEDGWSLALFTHCVAIPSVEVQELKDITKRLSFLNELIDAFKEGRKYSYHDDEKDFENHIDADFSSYNRAEVIGFFVGDYHIDKIDFSKSGIPYIFTGNAVMYYGGSPASPKRNDGDKSEVLFDVITVNKQTRKIYVTRVGAGEDRTAEY